MPRVSDVIVVGSGFGGAMAAHELVRAGFDVLMVERGEWVGRGSHNWEDDGTVEVTPYYSTDSLYDVVPSRRRAPGGGSARSLVLAAPPSSTAASRCDCEPTTSIRSPTVSAGRSTMRSSSRTTHPRKSCWTSRQRR